MFVSLCLLIVFMSTMTFGCTRERYFFSDQFYSPDAMLRVNQSKLSNELDTDKNIVVSFLRNSMSSVSGGVYTNYLESSIVKEHSTGHEILSESIGLMMLYAIRENDKDLFDEQFTLSVKAIMHPTYLVRWRVREDDQTLSSSSASIDDLRIVRALVLADSLWNEEKYSVFTEKISKDMLEYNTYKNHLSNYYNLEVEETGHLIDLSYMDVRTMALLTKYDAKWERVIETSMNVIENGMISDAFPMYYKTYDIEAGRYTDQDEVNIIDTLTTLLHLSEVNALDQNSVDWLYKQLLEVGHLYSSYDMNGRPVSKLESTAAYALLARLARTAGDEQLYKLAIGKMSLFQVKNHSSVIYGAFGNEKNA